jgi:hypothetical protein
VHSGEARQSVGDCGAIVQRCGLFGLRFSFGE